MGNRDLVLAAMAVSKGALHSPVQMQKLLFLLDRKLSKELDGPHFNFEPYDYGPFDRDVYDILDVLADSGLVEIIKSPSMRLRKYRTTSAGQVVGESVLSSLDPEVVQTITRLSNIVRSLSFADLVSAIYKAYPEMKANSVFQG